MDAKKTKLGLVGLCVLMLSLFQYTNVISMPVLASIMADMPEYAPTTVMWFQTLPSVGCIIGPILYSALSNKVPSRILVIIACAAIAVFGSLPALLGTALIPMLICRLIFGIAQGFIFTAPKVLINANMDEKTGAKWMGYLEVFGSIGMIFFQTASGYIGLIDWHLSMYLCLIMIVVAVVVGIALPAKNDPGSKHYLAGEGAVNARSQAASGEKLSFSKKYPASVWLYWIYVFVFVACIFNFQANTSTLVVAGGLGLSSDAGMILSCHTIVGMIGGIVFGLVFNKIKEFAIPTAALLLGISWMIIFAGGNLTALYIGAALSGFAAPLAVASCFQLSGRNAAAVASALAVSIALAAQNVGVIASPYIFAFIQGIFGMNAAAGRDGFLIGGIICFVLVVVSIITGITARNKAKAAQASDTAQQS